MSFYEPLHEILHSIDPSEMKGEVTRLDDDHSTDIEAPEDRYPFLNFAPLLNPYGGVKRFHRSFADERYFLAEDDRHPRLAAYVSSLTELANQQGKRAFLKYVRSQGRIGFLKKYLGGVHIALVRDCFSQFVSYYRNADEGNLYFLAASVAIFAQNVALDPTDFAGRLLPIPVCTFENIAQRQVFYQKITAKMTLNELYFIHSYLWHRQLAHAVAHADEVLSIYAPPDILQAFADRVAPHGLEYDFSKRRAPRPVQGLVRSDDHLMLDHLAQYCIHAGGHTQILRSLARGPLAVEPALGEVIDRLVDGDTQSVLSEYSISELLGVLREGQGPADDGNDWVVSRAFGAIRLIPPLLTRPNRRLSDPDDFLRFTARSLYLSVGASLRHDDDSGRDYISCAPTGLALVAFGPHFALDQGHYRFTIAYDAVALGKVGDEAAFMVEVVGQWGEVSFLAPTPKPLGPNQTTQVDITVAQMTQAVELKLHAAGVHLKVFSYTLERLAAQP